MKILISHKDIAEPTRGGVCELYKNLILGLTQQNFEVVYISTKNSWINNKSIRGIFLPRGNNPETHSKLVTKVIEQEKPDIAECSNWRFELLDFLRNRKSDCKTKVITRTDPPAITLFPGIEDSYREGEHELLRRSDFVIAVSKFTANEIKKHYSIRVNEVVYNGVDRYKIDELLQKKVKTLSSLDFKKQIFWVGRPNYMKGIDILKKVIMSTDRTWRFVLNHGQSLDNRILYQLRNKYNNITLIKDISKEIQLHMMRKSRYFLSTSRIEGFGIAALESLACGTPVVAYDQCEVLRELYPKTPAVRFFDDDDIKQQNLFVQLKTQKLSKEARAISNRYTAEQMVAKTIECYQKLKGYKN